MEQKNNMIKFNTITVNQVDLTELEDLILQHFDTYFDIRKDQTSLAGKNKLILVEKRELTSFEEEKLISWKGSNYSPLFSRSKSAMVLTTLCNAGLIPEGYLLISGAANDEEE